ncbi:DUF4386 family protein [Streptomonospora salina]|uniref:DUF4386 domain-containing protein n=1 Tax=Streptomonospora salina TaxID=104205 RepID=A0A841E9F0_9ACTN|nr:DUF4386 family protein [Streptomonospora salina]MBB5997939.1 hypothetical protein [Streptomonospora salina]
MAEPVPETATERVADDGRTQRFRAVTAGVLAPAGAVATTVGSLLQQRAEIPRGDPAGVLDHVAGHPWFAAALLAVLGTLCWAVAFPAADRTLRDPVSRAAARMAEPVLITAAAVFAVTYAHDGLSSGVLAQEWASGERGATALADIRVVEGLVGGTSILAQALLGLALALYALAMLHSRQYPRVLSWTGVVGTLGWFAGGTALFLQLPGASFALLLPFVGLATLWTLGVGIALLRQAPN